LFRVFRVFALLRSEIDHKSCTGLSDLPGLEDLTCDQRNFGKETWAHLDTGFSWFPCAQKANTEMVPKIPSCHYMLLM